jgi:hypothetical protein
MKPKAERDPNRPTEDDYARAGLGGPKGAEELQPATMTPRRQKNTPPERDLDPGHTV